MTIWSPIIGADDDDEVFKALADPTRRRLLDRLFERDGRTLTELESKLEMTRFGVMKHLQVLEGAGLVVTRRSGREKLHFLNPVPIRLIHDRWIDKYTERRVSALADLKTELEENRMTTTTPTTWRPGLPGVHQGDPGADLGRDHEERVHRALLLRRSDHRRRPSHYDSLGPERRASGATPGWRNSIRRARSFTAGARCYDPMRREEQREPGHLGDRGTGGRRLQVDRRPRPARGFAEDGRERLRRGWMGVLSGLKTLLETGKPLATD